MGQYWFEIFHQTDDRWAWQFVEVRGGQRRVLARSERDYGSRKKARKSVGRFVEALQGAHFVPGAGYRLPASKFAVDYGVVPLMAGVTRRGPRPRRRDRRERVKVVVQRQDQEAAAAQQPSPRQDYAAAAAAGPSEPELAAQAARAAQETKPTPPRRRRSTKAT